MVHIRTVKATSSSPKSGVFRASRPRYLKSNVFIERQIETVKHSLDKARKSGQDPHMPMICLRSTPIDSQLSSPAELLYQRTIQLNLAIRVGNQVPDRDAIKQRLTERPILPLKAEQPI